MFKKLNLVKEKLPKRKKKINDDDDNLFLKGMYSDYLQTQGYDVETIGINKENKETQTYEYYDDLEVEYQRFPWMIRKKQKQKITRLC